ncbi:hypothetical protein ASG51_22875 [Methylobacterium sp. Leaf465]|uniref:helix-turn-helix domain-containing protein n=1 Tax=Methylobacterium sp. Leaf465 TaxID=1736385 RepID=UPI0006FD44FD|nr:helix-turn-helix domain-containing protein [Methylobacterium sp. Leaf465]KQT74864.1 hypothetical protein ASG51_22875 [Methylobacterium sp. Leaf465]
MSPTKPITAMLNETEAAEMLAVSPVTLRSWRSRETGPPYRKHGGRVAYAVDELRAWSDSQRHPAPTRQAPSPSRHLV